LEDCEITVLGTGFILVTGTGRGFVEVIGLEDCDISLFI